MKALRMKPYIEKRFTAQGLPTIVEARAAKEEAEPRIIGYGAVYYDAADAGSEYRLWDDMLERVMPGCFDRAIREDDVRSFFNHDENQILGRNKSGTLALSVDSRGLHYEITTPDTQAGRDTTTSIRRGDVTGSSFMFLPRDTTWREVDGVFIRELNDVELWEVGPVVFPAYQSTTSEVRNMLRAEAQRHGFRIDRQPSVELRRRMLHLRARRLGL
jgi:HK97 family phage prohead protease